MFIGNEFITIPCKQDSQCYLRLSDIKRASENNEIKGHYTNDILSDTYDTVI